MEIIFAIIAMGAAVCGVFLISMFLIINMLDVSEDDLTEELEQTLERDLREFWL